MLTPIYKSTFKRDFKRAIRRGKDPEKIKAVVRLLCAQQPLPPTLHDHALSGDYAGYRDCHVESDLVLIYRIVENQLQLICVRLGTHSDLFE
ncbi:MAG: type II toxin-antitoxin system YafQ family toxin [Kiritimatiellae bacterium]|nr:type II toxin-antitoxin system YafQ family toxin [Kiritimatiellia bacterium]